MIFPETLYLIVFGIAAGVTASAVPIWRHGCRRWGWVDDPGHRKIHSTPVALAGGPAVFTGMVFVLILGCVAVSWKSFAPDVLDRLSYGLDRRANQLAAIGTGALGMLFLGWWDDRYELPAATKFFGQTTIAMLVPFFGVRITLFVPNLWFSYGVTILWIVTVTNALNFNDNMNGLCAGFGIIGSMGFAIIASVQGQYLVASLAFMVAGALTGFLPYNYPKASVFLGDSGSHLVGYWLAVLGILPHFYSRKSPGNPMAVLSPLLVLAVPLLDLVSVVYLRTRSGRPFWLGDTNHFSHRLVRAGFSRWQAVALLWVAAIFSSLLTGALR